MFDLLRKISLSVLLLPFLFGVVVASDFYVSGPDTVMSGEAAGFSVSGLLSDESLGFDLIRPDGSHIKFSAKSDEWGQYRGELYGAHLKYIGNYRLNVTRDLRANDVAVYPFEVVSGGVSSYRSAIELVDATAPADGESVAVFRVRLQDGFGNSVSGASVQIISSRNDDVVTHDLVSDENGIALGQVISATPGISTLTALVDDVVVFEKPELVFYLSDSDLDSVGADDDLGLGRFLKAQLFDDTESDAIARFEFEKPAGPLKAGETYTFTVKAIDLDGNVVPNYFGNVRFTSTDSKGQLPADYRYDEQDQGTHQFSLAFTFNTPGKHSLTVIDLSDFRITGETDFQVVGEGGNSGNGEGPSIEILTPTPGTYRSARVSITGKAYGVETLRIVDGQTLLVDDLPVDESGNFVYQTPALANGVHQFQAFDTGDTVNSQEVIITIDRLPPRVIAVQLTPPPPYDPNQDFELSIKASEPLSSAQCVLEDVRYDLSASGDKFVTIMQAPEECGEYIIGCKIADTLGNELDEPNAAKITVCKPLTEIVIDGGTGGDGELQPIDSVDDGIGDGLLAPTAVVNLSVKSVAEHKVTLTWSPSTDDKGIDHYRIEYGENAANLDRFNDLPDNRTQWYIDGLTEGTHYYFRVIAVDTDDLTSVPSNLVDATTLDLYPAADDLEPTGGSNVWAIVIAVIGGLFLMIGIGSRRNA